MRTIIAGGALLAMLAASPAPAQTQKVAPAAQMLVTPAPLYGKGFGEVSGFPFGPELLIIFVTYDRNSTTVHVRNVGSRELSVDLTFKCPDASCPAPRTVVVQPVSVKDDASRDQTYATNGSRPFPFEWGVRLVDDAVREAVAAKQSQPIVVSGSGQTNGLGIRIGSEMVKFYVATDTHSTGIYVRNVGTVRVHIKLNPACDQPQLCPPLGDAIVPPVSDPKNGANDYIYTVRVVNIKLPFSWTVWIPSDVPAAR
jgi:hypothetical protein